MMSRNILSFHSPALIVLFSVLIVISIVPIVAAEEQSLPISPSDIMTISSLSNKTSLTLNSTGHLFPNEVVTYVPSEGNGLIAVRILYPNRPRFADGAPVVIGVAPWIRPQIAFSWVSRRANEAGFVTVTYLAPGTSDTRTGARSSGTFDYGGDTTLAALRDVVKFATGKITNDQGKKIGDLLPVKVNPDNCGLYANSHAGIVSTRLFAVYGGDLTGLDYFIGRENPTSDQIYTREPGNYLKGYLRILNPFHSIDKYNASSLSIDYRSVFWGNNRLYFLCPDGSRFNMSKGFMVDGKMYYSAPLLESLLVNMKWSNTNWPKMLATPGQAKAFWAIRSTPNFYPLIKNSMSDLKVMLVFAAIDHFESAIDKPHIHQAYDGFNHITGLWTRLNPDRSYVQMFLPPTITGEIPDNPSNTEPALWNEIESWGYSLSGSPQDTFEFVCLAAMAEMSDRTETGNWSSDLPISSPEVTSLTPASIVARGPAFTLTVKGKGFINGCTVRWNGNSKPTTFRSSSRVSAAIPAGEIATPGTTTITVANPDGGVSNAYTLAVTEGGNPVPMITQLKPPRVVAGNEGLFLTIIGANFIPDRTVCGTPEEQGFGWPVGEVIPGSRVQWNGSWRETKYLNSTMVVATIPKTDLTRPGDVKVTVVNPAPGGGRSGPATFTIISADTTAPIISRIDPSHENVGGKAFSLTVRGKGFTKECIVRWNGDAHPTTYVSETELHATILASDLVRADTAKVTVTSPGGNISNPVVFTIDPPQAKKPSISQLSPAWTYAGGSAFTLEVGGKHFVKDSRVLWGGEAKQTTYYTPGRLTAVIPASDIVKAESVLVTVKNHESDGGTSKGVRFTVRPKG
jgi:hypothetical protein